MSILLVCAFCSIVSVLPITPETYEGLDVETIPTKKIAVVSLATLEWPPYTSSSIDGGGEIVRMVISVFRRMGYSAKVDFLPWSRAVRSTAGTQPLYLAYFPEYPLTENHFRLSDSLGISLVGLVQRIDRHLQLENANSLKNYRLGVVQDYINTKEIDELIEKKIVKPIVAINDRQNLVRVLNGDIDVAVIDKKVMQYIIANDVEINQRGVNELIFNEKLANPITLHLAFSRYHNNSHLFDKFNQTLAEIKAGNN